MDVVIISPEPGRHAEIGQRLLALAGHPNEVQWVTWPKAGYAVPLGLLVKFEASPEGPDYVTASVSEEALEGVESVALTEEPKKRGRPRKTTVVSTDQSEKEE